MTTKQMDYCIELARTQSFSRGSENMFVSQPTFSYQIRLLEGFLNDHSGQFAWIPYDSKEVFHCVLATHRYDNRESVSAFIDVLKQLYKDTVAFPL
ncbi:MAG: LysR family transcriptional regulator [Eubacterium sp.]|nr:LysR family transcriptional regulator [Eubacterium sp.]